MTTPSIRQVDAFLDDIHGVLSSTDGISPFTLIVGAGFSDEVMPSSQEVVERVPGWLHKEFSSFWKELNASLHPDERLDLKNTGAPDFATADAVNAAYAATMLHGLRSPANRREFYRSLCDEKKGQLNLAHLYLASILEAQGSASWNFKARRFCTTIFTTNFDPLLQVALQLMSKLYYMTDRPQTLEIPHDTNHDAIHLIYTHGSVHQAYIASTLDGCGDRV